MSIISQGRDQQAGNGAEGTEGKGVGALSLHTAEGGETAGRFERVWPATSFRYKIPFGSTLGAGVRGKLTHHIGSRIVLGHGTKLQLAFPTHGAAVRFDMVRLSAQIVPERTADEIQKTYLFSPVVIEMSFKSKKQPRISRIPRI